MNKSSNQHSSHNINLSFKTRETQIALGPNVEMVPWHIPPSYSERKELSLPYNLYVNATLSTIVWNPFHCIISEYIYALSISKQQSYNDKLMNQWIARWLKTSLEMQPQANMVTLFHSMTMILIGANQMKHGG
jgi:hypothetical protein